MMPERAFRNAIALSLLLFGLALVFYSIGGVLAFVADIATFSIQGDAVYDATFRVTVFVIALLYFFIGLSLIRARPRYDTADPDTGTTRSVGRVGPAALMAARTFSFILFMLGVVLLFNFTPYGRDTTLAAVMILAGVFGVAGTILYAKPDPNVAALGAVMAIIAAAMLLYAQLTVNIPDVPSQTYGAWETTNLAVPPVLGPIAIMIAGACGLGYAYVRGPRPALVAFIGLGVAGLVYGIGLCLVGLATVFAMPWYQFLQVAGTSMILLLSMAAGTALLVAAGVCCIVAALISFVRTARGFETRSATTTTTTDPQVTTTTTAQAWQHVPDAAPASPVGAVRDGKRSRKRSRIRARSTPVARARRHTTRAS